VCWCPSRCCAPLPPPSRPAVLCHPAVGACCPSPCSGFWPCVPVPPCSVVPPCGVVRVRAFSPLTRLDPAMSQTPLPFGHTACTLPAHAMGAAHRTPTGHAAPRLNRCTWAPVATIMGAAHRTPYGSCSAPAEQAYLGTGSHHHATGTGPAAQSAADRPIFKDFQPSSICASRATPQPGGSTRVR